MTCRKKKEEQWECLLCKKALDIPKNWQRLKQFYREKFCVELPPDMQIVCDKCSDEGAKIKK